MAAGAPSCRSSPFLALSLKHFELCQLPLVFPILGLEVNGLLHIGHRRLVVELPGVREAYERVAPGRSRIELDVQLEKRNRIVRPRRGERTRSVDELVFAEVVAPAAVIASAEIAILSDCRVGPLVLKRLGNDLTERPGNV